MISLGIMQTLILSIILYISFEAPSVNLIKLLMKREVKHKSVKQTSIEEQDTEMNNNNNHNNKIANGSEPIEMKDKSQMEAEKKLLISSA